MLRSVIILKFAPNADPPPAQDIPIATAGLFTQQIENLTLPGRFESRLLERNDTN
jgi:hypothetical protein